jgi:hypothetical protein
VKPRRTIPAGPHHSLEHCAERGLADLMARLTSSCGVIGGTLDKNSLENCRVCRSFFISFDIQVERC